MDEVKEIEISEFIQEFLEPIPGEKATGIDASNEEEYFKLNMEIPKTVPDYRKCIDLSSTILKEKSKDLKVASWLCFALFRTEKIKGLRDGLDLIRHLLIKYGNDLYPDNDLHRSKALQFLNTARFYKLLEREEIDKSNSEIILESADILNQIINESKKLFTDNVPVLKSIKDTLDSHVEDAKELIAPPPEPEEKIQEERTEDKKEEVAAEAENEPEAAPAPAAAPTPPPEKPPAPKAAPPPPKESKLSSERDAIKQLRQTLLFFFEKEIEGSKKEQIPELPFVFGLSRQLQWGRLNRPPDTDKITMIDAPNQIIQNKIKEWFAAEDWDTLIPRIEINFLKPDGEFPYWIEIQRYVTEALEKKGGVYAQASNEIKMNLAILLKRIPELPQLKFKDKQTPFAGSDTLKWIDDEIKPMLSGGGGGSVILPPIMGEEYESLSKEYETACGELPEKFEENLSAMQKGIMADERRKGKFLRRLNLANYCFAAKQYELAKINLFELSKLIDEYNLTEWEPALCTAVWQSVYITNKKIVNDTDTEEFKNKIEEQQKALFSKIAKYDGILAIKLTNN